MADVNQVQMIHQGAEVWNDWRNKYPQMKVDLSGANLRGADLRKANLREGSLFKADLAGANLMTINLRNSNLRLANLRGTILRGSSLRGADLRGANLIRADVRDADLAGADLTEADLKEVYLQKANLSKANLREANLQEADLRGASLRKANLIRANLNGANLQYATLVETELHQTALTGCSIYGISAWGLKGVPLYQSSLIITPDGEAKITVDDLQVAQFIYLLLNNENVRNVIYTITSKAVLIIGRFTPERKPVLDIIRVELHKHNYVPILFDFENTNNQSLLETVMTLAGMARFIIADVTAATMVREELRSIVEKYPAKPIQPILLDGELEYVTLPEIRSGFKNILPTYTYKDKNEVVSQLSEGIISPAERWLKTRKTQGKTEREIELEREIEALRKELQEKTT